MSLKNVAQETLALLQAGGYHDPHGDWVGISDWQQTAVSGTLLYKPEQLQALPLEGEGVADIQVIDATTQQAAYQMTRKPGRVALLNFASARNPGGGFLNGAKAQEEDLCRCSGLYPTLLTQMEYYQANRFCSSLFYTDHMIFSPEVPFFKIKGRGDLLNEPFRCSVITAPAPNAAEKKRKRGQGQLLLDTFRRRWRMVLALAQHQGIERLILGAWGCGAFGNEAENAAQTVVEWLERANFAEVVFAIPDRGKKGAYNHQTFQNRIRTSRP